VIGVFSTHWVEPVAKVLGLLGSRHVLVVHSEDGLDEISIGAPTRVAELKDGQVKVSLISPEQFGMNRRPISDLAAADAAQSLAIMRSVLDNVPGPARDVVQLNAGAAIYAAGLAPTLEQGVERAGEVIANGEARRRLDALVALTQSL
jgi:anthranilate phosphoribosyltransferase